MSTRRADDTDFDAMAAQVRSLPRLSEQDIDQRLGEARASTDGAARVQLVEQTLGTVLAAILARSRRATALDVMDLYQEGSLAATAAVTEYLSSGGAAAGLRSHVARAVDARLDEIIEREEAQRAADALLVARVELLQSAHVALRRKLEREPTTLELAGVLEWDPEQVETLSRVLAETAFRHDAELLAYLDDADPEDPDLN